MTMCPNSKRACECQPQEGVMCPHGPTPNDWPHPDGIAWQELADTTRLMWVQHAEKVRGGAA